MAKSRRPSAQAARAARGSANQGPRSGNGAGSALEEMLRRQAQNPRPGPVLQSPGTGQGKPAPAGREAEPAPKDRRQH